MVELFVLTWVLFVTTILTIALLSENLTNSLKVEMRSDRYLCIPTFSRHLNFESR